MNETIQEILAARVFAVVGVSANPSKFGYKVWRVLKENGKVAYPINPNTYEVEGEATYPTLAALPEVPQVVVSIVPPAVTETLPEQLVRLGVRYLWMQPGAESEKAVALAESLEIATVYGGPCLLVEFRRRRFES